MTAENLREPDATTPQRAAHDPRPPEWVEVECRPLPKSLDALLDQSVKRWPSNVLLDYFEDERSVTYAEFVELVDQMTAVLQRLGAGRGSHVGVMLPEVAEFPALTFALARLRAACVPINTRYTPSELDFVSEDAGICVLFIHADLVEQMCSSATISRLGREGVISVGADEAAGVTTLSSLFELEAQMDPLESEAELDDVCHIQYTSGTTGFPKGCLLTHRYWLVAGTAGAVLGTFERSLNDSPYFYMSGPMALVRAMQSGGAVVTPRRPSLRRFLSWLHEQRIDFCWFPEQLLKSPPGPLDRGHRLRRALIYQVGPDQLREAEERFGFTGRNLWAMTETGIGTLVPWDSPEMEMAGSIGVPMPFREFKIVDADLAEVEDGEAGELCVRGPGMFLGYHNRPEVNAELLIEGGWFRTGDQARRDQNGWLYFLGRMKDMIRRSGENIACAEVEHVLREMPEIADAAVVPVPDEWRGEEVKAYVQLATAHTRETVVPQAVYAWCSERLASFKVPRYLEYRDKLPRTPSDKVAKGVLLAESNDLRLASHDRTKGIWR